MITGPQETVDWDAVVRRSRRARWVLLVVGLLWMCSLLVVVGRGLDHATFMVTNGLVVAVLAAVAIAQRSTAGRPSLSDAARAAHALRHHVDPGGAARLLADRQARSAAVNQWALPAIVPLGLSQVLGVGADGQPVGALTAAAAVLVVVGYVVVGWGGWRTGRDGKRWLADPPGPPRPRAEAPSTERIGGPWRDRVWLTLMLLGGISLVVMTLVRR